MPPGSIVFNRLQQDARIRLKRKQLKIGPFRGRMESALGAGGRQFESGRPDQWNQSFVAIFWSTVTRIVTQPHRDTAFGQVSIQLRRATTM